MNRPCAGRQKPTPVWITRRHLRHDRLAGEERARRPDGRVGSSASPYGRFLPLMALVNPHPALKVSVPMNPMVDAGGATTGSTTALSGSQMMAYIHDQEADRKSEVKWWTSHYDDYDMFLAGGVGGGAGRRRGSSRWLLAEAARTPELRRVLERPGVDKILADEPLRFP